MDLNTLEGRKAFLKESRNEENKARKRLAWAQSEIYRDRQAQYVRNYLLTQMSEQTLKETPVWSSINLTRRIVKQEASIYRNAPKREFIGASDVQASALQAIYSDAHFDQRMQRLNEAYKLHGQAFLMIVPKQGKLIARVLAPHQLDVIPSLEDPEQADAYVVSAFDRQYEYGGDGRAQGTPTVDAMLGNKGPYSDAINQRIADTDDYKASTERYVVWTRQSNFIMNGKGELVSDESPNPIGLLPFVEVAMPKDYEFWVRSGNAVVDFSIQFNGAITDVGQVVRMQGWGQAYLVAEQDLIPENIQVGPNYILRLPVNPQSEVRPEFGFANASPDVSGSLSFVNSLLSMFLSSRGINPKLISSEGEQERYTSGLDRLLGMLERFEATAEDFSRFEDAEAQAFEIIKAWHDVMSGTDGLAPKYSAPSMGDAVTLSVAFERPQMIQSDAERLQSIRERVELGLMSRIEAIMQDRGITREQALEVLDQIDGTLAAQPAREEDQDNAEQHAEEEEKKEVNE